MDDDDDVLAEDVAVLEVVGDARRVQTKTCESSVK